MPAGLEVVSRHGDDGVSGSTPVSERPAGRNLMADALAGRFQALVVESLDRLSRDQVELERVVRRLEHVGIRVISISDGYDSTAAGRKVIRAVRGIVAELYLDDLRLKTHRGLAGQINRGFIASGKSFGYRIVRAEGGSSYQIDDAQARWVRWIFDRYANGAGIRAVAFELNRLGAPSPRGGTWTVSALYGSPVKGSGILNNPLYVGRMVWNRSQWVKDPDTGKRHRLDRPPSEWLTRDAPELRIIDDETWRAVRARIDDGRGPTGRKRAQRPIRTIFGGLMRCPHCDAPMIAVSATRYGCNARNDRGPSVCPGFTVSRRLADRRLVDLIREQLLGPAAVMEAERIAQEMRSARPDAAKEEAARRRVIEAQIGRLVEAIATMGVSPALQARLRAAEAERDRLAAPARLAAQRPIDVRAQFTARLDRLNEALERDSDRARMIVAELLGPIHLEVLEDQIWGECDAGRALAAAVGESTTVSAGPRNQRYRFRLK